MAPAASGRRPARGTARRDPASPALPSGSTKTVAGRGQRFQGRRSRAQGTSPGWGRGGRGRAGRPGPASARSRRLGARSAPGAQQESGRRGVQTRVEGRARCGLPAGGSGRGRARRPLHRARLGVPPRQRPAAAPLPRCHKEPDGCASHGRRSGLTGRQGSFHAVVVEVEVSAAEAQAGDPVAVEQTSGPRLPCGRRRPGGRARPRQSAGAISAIGQGRRAFRTSPVTPRARGPTGRHPERWGRRQHRSTARRRMTGRARGGRGAELLPPRPSRARAPSRGAEQPPVPAGRGPGQAEHRPQAACVLAGADSRAAAARPLTVSRREATVTSSIRWRTFTAGMMPKRTASRPDRPRLDVPFGTPGRMVVGDVNDSGTRRSRRA
jgi:hypothetical protein